ncbi:MAG TPA: hypothetical protein VEX86_11275 [Longimicrobium sp.]|nr:hypothetical protein [Longimicrobium sp.]
MKHAFDTRFARLARLGGVAALAVMLAAVASAPAAAQGSTQMSGSGGGMRGAGSGGPGGTGLFRNDVASTDTRVAAPPAVLWRATAEVLGEMGFEASEASNSAGMEFVSTFANLRGRLFNRPNAEFFSCNSGDLLNDLTATGRINMALRARVAADPQGGSVLHTQIDARAQRRSTSATPVTCDSTGKLEQRVAQQIGVRVQEILAESAPRPATPPAAPTPE